MCSAIICNTCMVGGAKHSNIIVMGKSVSPVQKLLVLKATPFLKSDHTCLEFICRNRGHSHVNLYTYCTLHSETSLAAAGTPDALTLCIGQICNIMLENPPRGPLIPYKPHALPNQAYQPRVNVGHFWIIPLSQIIEFLLVYPLSPSLSPLLLPPLLLLFPFCPISLRAFPPAQLALSNTLHC